MVSYADIGPTVTFKEEQVIKDIVVSNRLEDGYDLSLIYVIPQSYMHIVCIEIVYIIL